MAEFGFLLGQPGTGLFLLEPGSTTGGTNTVMSVGLCIPTNTCC